MDYIEEYLMEEVFFDELVKKIGIFVYYFKWIFLFIVGMSLVEYIKKRCLVEVNLVLFVGEKVIDVVFKYGY